MVCPPSYHVDFILLGNRFSCSNTVRAQQTDGQTADRQNCIISIVVCIAVLIHEPQQVMGSQFNLSHGSITELECDPKPNVMAALPNTGGALCSTPQGLADAYY